MVYQIYNVTDNDLMIVTKWGLPLNETPKLEVPWTTDVLEERFLPVKRL